MARKKVQGGFVQARIPADLSVRLDELIPEGTRSLIVSGLVEVLIEKAKDTSASLGELIFEVMKNPQGLDITFKKKNH